MIVNVTMVAIMMKEMLLPIMNDNTSEDIFSNTTSMRIYVNRNTANAHTRAGARADTYTHTNTRKHTYTGMYICIHVYIHVISLCLSIQST